MKKYIFIAIFLSVALKIILINYIGTGLNPDEHNSWIIAKNHLSGKGYALEGKERSYHSSFCAFLYEGLQLLGVKEHTWGLFCAVISVTLFIVSVFYFQRLLKLYAPNFVFTGTLIYLFYPSAFYIGSLQFYENITMPLLIIVFTIIVRGLKEKNLTRKEFLFIALAVIISSWLRPSVIFIYLVLLIACFILARKYRIIFFLLIALLFIAQVPAVIKNYKQFGSPILSTQAGFELLQGHNELARGSWQGEWRKKDNDFNKYIRLHINPDTMNESQESKAHAAIALDWIKKNPAKELFLTFRKTAIYFYPQNYESLPTSRWLNPLNVFVHLGFIIFCVLFWKLRGTENYLLIAVPAGCLLLSIIFFVEYRIRFYAEPFMIISTLIVLNRFYKPVHLSPKN